MNNSFGQKTLDNLFKILSKESFCKEVLLITGKYGIKPSAMTKKYIDENSNIIKNYILEISNLATKYGLNDHYTMLLSMILIFGVFPDKETLNKIKPYEIIECKDKNGVKCLAIKIYPETTKKDIYDNWAAISKNQKDIYREKVTKIRRPRNRKLRDFLITGLKCSGQKNAEISKTINKIFDNDFLTGTDVGKILDRNGNKSKRIIAKNK